MIDWEIVASSLPALAVGLAATIKISFLAIIIGTLLGVALGLGQFSRFSWVRGAILAYVDFIRGTPLLIQIFIVYFALPVVGLRFNEFWAGVIALSLNAAAYIAETVRGGIASVERGQSEAAMSIGMSQASILIYILLPQAARAVVPSLTNELITLTKNSSLLSVISVYELTRAGQAIISVHFVPFELYGLIAIYYYVVISGLSRLSRYLERRLPSW